MAYMHIKNLYQVPQILDLFRHVYVLEKIMGSSAWITLDPEDGIGFYAGQEYGEFLKMFQDKKLMLLDSVKNIPEKVTIYGEIYGGKILRQSKRYGLDVKFVVFDVRIGRYWLDVEDAYNFAIQRDLEFVDWRVVDCKMDLLDYYRDIDSVQAERNGYYHQLREGIVIRPTIELLWKNGERVIAKHKGAAFSETNQSKPREVSPEEDITRLAVEKYVTKNRLMNLISHFDFQDIAETPKVISAMIEDVYRECDGEVPDTKDARKMIARITGNLYKKYIIAQADW